MDLDLKGKAALVTGGTRGIGRAIAFAMLGEGCQVAVCARHKVPVLGCLVIEADADQATDRERVVRAAMLRLRGVEILVNNVGGLGRVPESIDHLEGVLNRNAVAAAHFTSLFLRSMVEHQWGRVITISSIYGKEGGGQPWFTMAKAAEIALMKSLSLNRRYDGITFNTVCPGPIQVGNPQESGRMGQPEDVANLVAFLCSDKARWINGACITVDGGESRSF